MDDPDPRSEATVHLISRYRAGDQEAGNALWTRYCPRVWRIVAIRARAWGLHVADAEEVLQDTVLAAARSIDRYEEIGEGGFIHWLATIAVNKLRDLEKGRRALKCDRGREVPIGEVVRGGESSAAGWQPAGDSTRIPDRVDRAERIQLTDACLAVLREDYREVILLHVVAGCTWSTVAERLGRGSVGATRKLYTRARAALAAEMKRRRPGLQTD